MSNALRAFKIRKWYSKCWGNSSTKFPTEVGQFYHVLIACSAIEALTLVSDSEGKVLRPPEK